MLTVSAGALSLHRPACSVTGTHVLLQSGAGYVDVTSRLVNFPTDGERLSETWQSIATGVLNGTLLTAISQELVTAGGMHCPCQADARWCSSAHAPGLCHALFRSWLDIAHLACARY